MLFDRVLSIMTNRFQGTRRNPSASSGFVELAQ
jgi:hypothetical protein